MRQSVGWILLIIGIVIISLSVVLGAFSESVYMAGLQEAVSALRQDLSKGVKLDQNQMNTIINTLMLVNIPKKAESVGYILGGSIGLAGLVIIVITAIFRKEAKSDLNL